MTLKGEHVDNVFLQKLAKISATIVEERITGLRNAPKELAESADKPDTTRPFAKNSSAFRKPVKSIHSEKYHRSRERSLNYPRKASDAVFHVSNTTNVLILAGQARVLNPTTKALEPVYVILDTGTGRSFISSSLAERPQLKDVDSSRLSIGTFGAHKPFERTCGITVLRMWDAEGVPHTSTVTKIDTVTKPLTRSRLSQEDKQFLFENDIHLSINHTVEKILLGCADFFSFLKHGPGAQATLPSGLKAIPSRLGYLISGRSGEELVNSESSVGVAQTIALEDKNNDFAQTWEQFCEFEKSGVKEFLGPITEKLKQTNAEQYDDTIKSQLELGIIEEVAEDLIVEEGEVVRYLAHQAVVTPHKETTSVVFDTSAHLSNFSSLNDVLYQGPVILQKMWDILLRFRFGDVAIISNVEKAFLQVRLHPKDRNATRFMWVRGIHQPLTRENLVFFWLPRVPFGLNCSPFLLAGTIVHHLRTHVEDQLAMEIEDNTCVDNLVVTKRSSDEGLRFYNDSKVVFKELNMNLREFQSNDKQLKRRITSADLAGNDNPSPWNTMELRES
ncbi:hypothetical protein RB195_022538 [Necator americanus]|uniref:DUF1758 domain-containing protein n=1 Tax=Necator americanus TaxID=51031 RepID=A0ABR1EFP4_NECAM